MTDKVKSPSPADVGRLRAAYNRLGQLNGEGDAAFGAIVLILRRYGKVWSDLLGLIATPSSMATDIPPEDRKVLREQHEVLGNSVADRKAARKAILWVLERHRLTWNDLLGVISGVDDFDPSASPLILLPVPKAPDPLDLLTGFLHQFFDVTEDETIAIALWILHTYAYEAFENTPRLLLSSPVPSCGKTTVLEAIKLLGRRPLKADGITPAAIVQFVHAEKRPVLLDEADNNAWAKDYYLRRVVNGGHHVDGQVSKLVDHQRRQEFSTFAPLALASLVALPLPLVSRSILIHLKMTNRSLKRIAMHREDFDVLRRHVVDWMQGRKFNPDPELPAALPNRVGDNWRAMISIADSCEKEFPDGRPWGAVAREVAGRMSARFRDVDLRLVLLSDIRKYFLVRGVDRVATDALVGWLVALDGQPWAEWYGIDGTSQTPRRLTSGLLSFLLRPFGIRVRNHRFIGPPVDGKTHFSGYRREQFEESWVRYLRDASGAPSEVHNLTAAE